MADIIQTALYCATFLVALFLGLLALPQSPIRNLFLEICGWTGAAAGTAAILSPIDAIPDVIPIAGQIDDVGYLIMAALCGVLAYTQRKHRTTRAQPPGQVEA